MLKSLLGPSLMVCSLTSCIPIPVCNPVGPLEAAAGYNWLQAGGRYGESLNTWVENERLQRFLLEEFQQGGIEALKSRFGFECEPRKVIPACEDCYVCRASLVKQVAPQEDAPFEYHCTKSGEMLMQVEAGPGRHALNAMTYWRRPPLGSAESER